jgi:hypothetical protein
MTEKLCNGPSHAEPTWLPVDADHWWFHRSGKQAGKPFSHCKACDGWPRMKHKESPHGLVPKTLLLPYLRELIERCGSKREVTVRYGIARSVQIKALYGSSTTVQKRTFQRVLVALRMQRKIDRRNGHMNDEYRSKRIAVAVREKKMMEGYAS